MEQYRQILENAARSELRITVIYSVLLVAVAMALVVCGLSIASKHFEKCHHTVDACENVSYHIDH